MFQNSVRCLVFGILFLKVADGSAMDDDAARLVRSVRERESWIERVKSLEVEAEVRWKITPEGIAKRRWELQNQLPGQNIEGHSDLLPQDRETVELAFDSRRVRKRNHLEVHGTNDLRVWDGHRFILQNRFDNFKDRDSCLINRDPGNGIYWLVWVDFPAFRAGHHSFWWEKPQDREANERLAGRPEDFVLGGRANYRGVDCHVLNLWGSWTTLYVGVTDGRLHGLKSGNLGGDGFEARLLAWLKHEGHPLRDIKEWSEWLGKLTNEQRIALFRKQAVEMTSLIEPCFEFWLDDEKELAPGCWLPMSQGSIYYFLDPNGKLTVETTRDVSIKKAIVNSDLPDAVFEVTIKPGDRVLDETVKPPL